MIGVVDIGFIGNNIRSEWRVWGSEKVWGKMGKFVLFLFIVNYNLIQYIMFEVSIYTEVLSRKVG